MEGIVERYQGVLLAQVVPAGGPSDTTARSIADGLAKVLGQPVVVENRPGAGAIIGSEVVLAQPADGHTLLMASNMVSTGKWLYPTMSFHPLRDFRAVAGVFRSPHQVVVTPNFQGKTIQDLVAMAKQQDGKMTYGSGGMGTMPHLGAERFKQVTGVNLMHIPYRGSAPANTAVLAGEVPVHFDIEFSAQSLLKAGACARWASRRCSVRPRSPTCPRSTNRASRASSSTRGSASWRAAARRRPSSPSSIRRSTR